MLLLLYLIIVILLQFLNRFLVPFNQEIQLVLLLGGLLDLAIDLHYIKCSLRTLHGRRVHSLNDLQHFHILLGLLQLPLTFRLLISDLLLQRGVQFLGLQLVLERLLALLLQLAVDSLLLRNLLIELALDFLQILLLARQFLGLLVDFLLQLVNVSVRASTVMLKFIHYFPCFEYVFSGRLDHFHAFCPL